MKVVISGASGLIGSALRRDLVNDGHEVVSLVRREARHPDESSWDPPAGRIDHDVLASADVVVNLAGASIGDKRLDASYAVVVQSSRTDSTGTITRALAEVDFSGVLLQGSAMGFYGEQGDDPFDESAAPGSTLLADIVRAWEDSAQPALDAGIRTVFCRTGLVLADHGGFAQRLLPLIKMGLLRSLGSGRTFHSWIALADEVAAMRFLIDSEISGPVNMIAPHSVRDYALIKALADAARRPRLFPVPGLALKAVTGAAADDLLSSQNGRPGVLLDAGFSWAYPEVEDAALYVMGSPGR